MSRPPDDRSGPDVQAWLDEVSEAPPGDFGDVLMRAKELPGAQLSAQDIEDASRHPADEAELRARLNFGTIEDFLDAATAFVAEQGGGEPPPMVGVGVAPTGRRWAWLGAGMAAAIAVGALAIWWAQPRDALDLTQGDSAYAAAADRSDPGEAGEAAAQRSGPRRGTPAPVEPPPEPEPEPKPEPEVGTDTEAEVEARDAPISDVPRTAPRPSLEALDAEARAAWKSGDLDRARRLFERVVARGRGRERADVAYGDLFTLARRQGNDAALRRYWKRYVKRFPRGRYIDDARAGLCRAARGDARTRCWERYLEARPRGTYREDAEAALGSK